MRLLFLLTLLPSFLLADPIVHTVFFKLKEEQGSLGAEAFRDESLKLAEIPGVEHFQWVKETSPKNDFDYGLTMEFADQAAYDFYNYHPKHVAYVENVWVPNVADFMEVDYEVASEWTDLLDLELSQWEIWTGVPDPSITDLPAGIEATPEGTKMNKGNPVGLGDPFEIFSVSKDETGELVMNVTGEVYAGLTTFETYENYHLTLAVKWGEKKWAPRLDQKRDSGLLYHCYGEHGAFWNVWKSCLELQIQEGDMGDLFQLAGPSSVTWRTEENIWDPNGMASRHKGRVIRSVDTESPYGEWTRIDLYVIGDRAIHVVNGTVVLALEGAQNHLGEPLVSGQIQLQSEGAECHYKDIRIRPIQSFPPAIEASLSPALVGWKPAFNDAPVPAERSAAIDKALPSAPIVSPKAKRRVLVFSATSGFRHKSIPTGKEALVKLGESTGAFKAIVSDDPAYFEAAALQSFDTVILLSPTLDFFMPNEKQRADFSDEEWAWLKARHDRLVDNLVAYVEQGGGLMGIHSATDSCYHHTAYGETIGGYFDGHPWRKDNQVTIVVEDPEHATIKPVFGAMKDFEIIEEIYQFKPEPYSRERLRILLHLDPDRSDPVERMKRSDGDYPVAWVQSVGMGRVFYSSLGHNHHIFSNPMLLKHFLAGIQFACGDLEADTTPSAKLAIPNLGHSSTNATQHSSE